MCTVADPYQLPADSSTLYAQLLTLPPLIHGIKFLRTSGQAFLIVMSLLSGDAFTAVRVHVILGGGITRF